MPADALRGDLHDSGLYFGVPAHAQVVVAAPDRDVLLVIAALLCQGEVGAFPRHLPEDAIRVVILLPVHFVLVKRLVVEELLQRICRQQRREPFTSADVQTQPNQTGVNWKHRTFSFAEI